jgi:Ca2+-binding EF-hand superfamily protein
MGAAALALPAEGAALLPALSELPLEEPPYSMRDALAAFEARPGGGFGFDLSADAYARLLPKLLGGAAGKDAAATWHVWDSDGNGVADVREVLAASRLAAKGALAGKAAALYTLFHVSDEAGLSLDEWAILVRTCVSAAHALVGSRACPRGADLARLAASLFRHVDADGDGRISRGELQRWVAAHSSELVPICRWGTHEFRALSGAQQTLHREASQAAAAASPLPLQPPPTAPAAQQPSTRGARRSSVGRRVRFSPLAQEQEVQTRRKSCLRSPAGRDATGGGGGGGGGGGSSSSGGGGGGGGGASEAGGSKAAPCSLEEVKMIKAVFDKMDRDQSGSISTAEFSAQMKSNSFFRSSGAVFASLDEEKKGSITFADLLRRLYPTWSDADIARCDAMVRVPAVTKHDIDELHRVFEGVDIACKGRAELQRLLQAMHAPGANPKFAEWAARRAGRVRESTPVTFQRFLIELFQKVFPERLMDIVSFAPPVRRLSPAQQHELETLFAIYDTDGSGFVSLVEVAAQVSRIEGFTPEDVEALFDMFDRDGNREVSLDEFKAFYRNVWGVSILSESASLPDDAEDIVVSRRSLQARRETL